ncbi:histidine phosphatase family protein [Azospirillum thermophilum]|uniref:Histidine phosphatase family protein n=1 Tax=Azospirillum thermophilum TaxID=2202148 RepID=A0A2S2CYD5_9PROT|nr:histidine phosphatase family protein [Azospirillum thermophilum]AWK89478.1 histidine phosphatase family protein [Azospirillum thermophilum]
MGRIRLVRHGQASFLAEDYDRLSETGMRQSVALGAWLRRTGQDADLVLRGSLRRHRETAEACLAAWKPEEGRPVETVEDAAFDEFDHLDVLGALRPELRAPGALAAFLRGQDDPRRAFQALFVRSLERWTAGGHGGHGGDYRESWTAFRERCAAGLRRAIERAPSGSVWVFTSGGPVAVACQQVLGLSDRGTLDLNAVIANTGVTTLLHGRGRLSLGSFNATGHLEAACDAGLLTLR